MAVQIQARRGTATQWSTENPVLASGEPGLETDTGLFKWGNGTDAWNDLDYASGGDNATGRRGAMVVRTSSQLMSHNTLVAAEFDTAIYDTADFWTAGSPSRLTIPVGVSQVRIRAQIHWGSNGGWDNERLLLLQKNGSVVTGGIDIRTPASDDGTRHGGGSAILGVEENDYFQVFVRQRSGGSHNMTSGTWFEIEVIE